MKKSSNIIVGIIGTIVFFGIIYGYFTEFEFIDNTIGVSKLILYSGIIGLAIGILLAIMVLPKTGDSIDRTRNSLFIAVLFGVALPMLALKTNRWFANKNKEIVSFTFIKQKPVLAKPFGQMKFESTKPTYYLVYLSYQGKNITFKSKNEWVNNAMSGKEVFIPVYRGFWGYYIADTQGLLPNADTI